MLKNDSICVLLVFIVTKFAIPCKVTKLFDVYDFYRESM